METKNILIICVSIILVIAIIVGALIFIGYGSVEMENKDFGPFTMDVPKGSIFNQGLSTYGGLQGYGGVGFLSWNNNGKYSEEIAYVSISTNSIPLRVPNDFTFEKTEGDLDIYSDRDIHNRKIYLICTSKNNFNFEFLGKDLNVLKKAVNSIVVSSDAINQLDTSSQSSTSSTNNVNSISSSNDASYTRYCIIHEWVTTGSDYLCPYCVEEGYPAETTANYKACPKHKDRGDGYCAYCLHQV